MCVDSNVTILHFIFLQIYVTKISKVSRSEHDTWIYSYTRLYKVNILHVYDNIIVYLYWRIHILTRNSNPCQSHLYGEWLFLFSSTQATLYFKRVMFANVTIIIIINNIIVLLICEKLKCIIQIKIFSVEIIRN